MGFFVRFVGKLPLAGKVWIKPAVFSLYLSTTKTERRRRYLSFIALLGFLVLVHAYQAKLGIEALYFNAPIWAKVLMGLFALVNISVTLAQISLGLRATRFFFFTGRGRFSSRRKCDADFSESESRTMLIVTLGGQFIFIFLYVWYM